MNIETLWTISLLLLITFQLIAPIYNYYVFYISRKERLKGDEAQLENKDYPPAMLVIPIYNDGKTIRESLDEVEKINYPSLSVLLINDCSTDNTEEVIRDWIFKERKFTYKLVSHPKNSGTKAKALNRAIDHFNDGLIVITDGDTFLHSEAIKRLVDLKKAKGENCSTVSGKILIRDCDVKDFIGTIQKYEHDYLYMHTKLFQSYFGAVVVSSGALLLIEKKDIIEHGNFDDDVLVEDIVWSCGQISIKKRESAYCHNAIAYTSPQPTAKALLFQRERWAYGLYEVLEKKYISFPKSFADFIVFSRILLVFPRQIIMSFLVILLLFKYQFIPYIALAFLIMVATWDYQVVALTRSSKFIENCKQSKIKLVSIIMAIRVLVIVANIRVLTQVLMKRPKTWKTR